MYYIYDRDTDVLVFKTNNKDLLRCFDPDYYEVVIY